MSNQKEDPIINCHTHIFTSDSVPPLLAKTFVPWPFYWILHIGWMVWLVNWYYNSKYSPYQWPYQRWYKLLQKALYKIKIAASRYWIWGLLKFLLGIVIIASMFYELYGLYLCNWMQSQGLDTVPTDKLTIWLENAGILIISHSWVLKGILLILLLTFFPSGRNLLLFILKKFSRFFGMLPGKQSTELAKRYFNIVRFARYKDQHRLFSRLKLQYPPGSAMVVLPMDMEFMEAGKPRKSYAVQMEDLVKIKNNHPKQIYPFIFVDPRRKSVGNTPFFDYTLVNGSVILNDCFINTYIKQHHFSGFKIYPALGYFPFDEVLLPLWKFAADNNIPILTHCIRGTIYYRGKKKKEWDQHPVFEQYEGNTNEEPNIDVYFKPLDLPQTKAVDVQEIFTHPLNYACLLKRQWLAVLVKNAKDDRIRELFGYNKEDGSIAHGLEHLKICFGHFGGDDEWARHMEKDRDNWAHMITTYPKKGIYSLDSQTGIPRDLAEKLWKYADWYTIICSLMLQHDNVYADISYILHSEADILPTLKQTLQNETLRSRVLFGTDYYVVRNHKADKKMLADWMGGLSMEDFNQIARVNPKYFLTNNYPS